MNPEVITAAPAAGALYWALPLVLALVIGSYLIHFLYAPRSYREWQRMISDSEVRRKLRERKRRLDAIRRRKPGSILPGIPTSQRDFALEPLIRNRQFKQAKSYIMEQIRRHRDSPGGEGRMHIYLQYLELIEGTA